ncbi:MAG: DUF1015 domain-containing protein [Janthinobacterium lividum]
MRIYPFRALRYNTQKVALSDVVTQPYDKISPAMQQAYYDRSPFNLIRVILGKRDAADTETSNVYTRAAQSLQDWRKEAVLVEEREPALYGYAQRYTVPGTSEVRERRGLICLGHLYDYAEQVVYRHEQTLSKPKSDRLSLFKATRTYCEQIYMLYSDPAFTVEKLVFGNASGEPITPPSETVTDEYGVVHSVWKVTDAHVLNLLVGALADKKLIIADGHHRYETSTSYARERAAELGVADTTMQSGKSQQQHGDSDESPSNDADMTSGVPLPVPPFPEAAMMMTLVNTDAPGITILPTHRIVYGLKDFSSAAFLERAGEFFDISKVDSKTAAAGSDAENVETAAERTAPLNGTAGVAFLAVMKDGTFLLEAKKDAIEAALQHVPPRQRALDVVQLHALVLEQLLDLTPESIRNQENLRYLRSAEDAAAQVARGEADIAFLIKPVTLDQMKEVSLSGEVMPQKSTDFYPKLLSGLAFYALD